MIQPVELQKLGKYEIRATLGRGAMGTVYEAWDPVIARRVAIKTVTIPDAADTDAREQLARFQREAQAAGRLTHPNIVGLFDYGEVEDLAYIVMEYVDGKTLKSVLDNGERFALSDIVRLMDDLLAGLQFSHDHGVVHRDIKPANLILTAKGALKIADFGIARIESSNMTQAGDILGTPAYMSPEQFKGETVDNRTDIYSCGVVLYQLLTGERPFEGSMTAIMHKALNTTPPMPSELAVTAPGSMDPVVARAMAKRPEQRYASASEFGRAIHTALDGPEAFGLPAGSQPAGDPTVVSKSAKPAPSSVPASTGARPAAASRLPLLAGLAALVLLILGGGAWYFWPSGKAPTPPPQRQAMNAPVVQAPTVQTPVVQTPVASPPVTPPDSRPQPTEPPVAQAPAVQPPVASPPVTPPPDSRPQPTEPPVAQAPAVQPPATQPPVTQRADAPPAAPLPVIPPPVAPPPVTSPQIRATPATPPPVIASPATPSPVTPPPAAPLPIIPAPVAPPPVTTAPVASAPATPRVTEPATPPPIVASPTGSPVAPSPPARPFATFPTVAVPQVSQPAAEQPPAVQSPVVQPPAVPPPAPLAPVAQAPVSQPPVVQPPAPPPPVVPTPAPQPLVVQQPITPTPATPALPQPTVLAMGPNLASLRSSIAAAIAPLPCTLARGDVTPGGGARVMGLTARGQAAGLRRAISDAAPIAALDWHVDTFEGPYCRAVELLRPIATRFGSAAPGLDLMLRNGQTTLQKDDYILFSLTIPEFSAYLQVDYLQHDGSVYHLYPGPTETPTTYHAHRRVAFGEPKPGFSGWQVDEPYGTEMIIAIASSVPLFTQRRPESESAETYLRDLQAALDAARRREALLAGSATVVETRARR